MIQKYKNPSTSGPSLADAKPNGMDLYFADGTITHVPIPSFGPGYLQTHATSLRNDAVVIAYDPEDNSDTISIVSTRDKGQSWQSVNLAVENAKKYSHYYLSFQDAEKGILMLCGEDGNSGLIYSTENAGTTWSSAIPFSSPDAIYNVTSSGDSYCIAGENNSHPVILQSGDGASWNELILPLDANEYPEGYCTYAVFSGDTGLAVVIGIKAEGGTAWLYFSSEDNGQSWSLYKTGR